jgi:hypothetical protein
MLLEGLRESERLMTLTGVFFVFVKYQNHFYTKKTATALADN